MRRLGFAALVLFGCTEDLPPGVASQIIGADGGQLTSKDGVLTLLFHAGSLSGETEVRIAPSERPPPTFGPAYRVTPDIDLGVPMDVAYHDMLPATVNGAAIVVVRREAFASGNGNWTSLPVLELDAQGQLVASTDSEISIFYGLVEGAVNPTTSTTTTASTTITPTTMTTEDPTTGGVETDTEDPETSDTDVTPLSYVADIEPIFLSNCMGGNCHGNGQQNPLLAVDGYANIVNQPSLSASASLVVPFDSTSSYVMHKMDATHNLDASLGGCGCAGVGGSMPLAEELLPAPTRQLVRDWIDDGAEP